MLHIEAEAKLVLRGSTRPRPLELYDLGPDLALTDRAVHTLSFSLLASGSSTVYRGLALTLPVKFLLQVI